jgi:hypothetical protein
VLAAGLSTGILKKKVSWLQCEKTMRPVDERIWGTDLGPDRELPDPPCSNFDL